MGNKTTVAKAGGIGGTVAIIIIGILNQSGIDLGPEVTSALSTLIGSIVAYLTK